MGMCIIIIAVLSKPILTTLPEHLTIIMYSHVVESIKGVWSHFCKFRKSKMSLSFIKSTFIKLYEASAQKEDILFLCFILTSLRRCLLLASFPSSATHLIMLATVSAMYL